MHLLKFFPFEKEFLFFPGKLANQVHSLIAGKTSGDSANAESQVSTKVFGILPWNSKGYLTCLFRNYAYDRGFFESPSPSSPLPEFYFFVPEILLARLQPTAKRDFEHFRSGLSVLTSLFCSEFHVLTKETADVFFPYPQVARPNSFAAFPHKLIDNKQLYLVKVGPISFDKSAVSF